jgi:Acetoacetate decarboxylase (ADC)
MNILERYFAPASGAIREFVGINAFFEPADLGLYERLLPSPLGVPDRPLVNIAVVDYLKAAPWPLTGWQEWGVSLKCVWRGQPGWYPVTAPVSKWLPMRAGRYLGYPKYVADSITLARRDDCWTARAVQRGVHQLEAEFEPGIARPAEPWAEELWANESFFKDDVYLVLPPGVGARVQRVSFKLIRAQWTSRSGTVRVEPHPDQPWARLVPGPGPFVGQHSHFRGGLNLVVEKLPAARPGED